MIASFILLVAACFCTRSIRTTEYDQGKIDRITNIYTRYHLDGIEMAQIFGCFKSAMDQLDNLLFAHESECRTLRNTNFEEEMFDYIFESSPDLRVFEKLSIPYLRLFLLRHLRKDFEKVEAQNLALLLIPEQNGDLLKTKVGEAIDDTMDLLGNLARTAVIIANEVIGFPLKAKLRDNVENIFDWDIIYDIYDFSDSSSSACASILIILRSWANLSESFNIQLLLTTIANETTKDTDLSILYKNFLENTTIVNAEMASLVMTYVSGEMGIPQFDRIYPLYYDLLDSCITRSEIRYNAHPMYKCDDSFTEIHILSDLFGSLKDLVTSMRGGNFDNLPEWDEAFDDAFQHECGIIIDRILEKKRQYQSEARSSTSYNSSTSPSFCSLPNSSTQSPIFRPEIYDDAALEMQIANMVDYILGDPSHSQSVQDEDIELSISMIRRLFIESTESDPVTLQPTTLFPGITDEDFVRESKPKPTKQQLPSVSVSGKDEKKTTPRAGKDEKKTEHFSKKLSNLIKCDYLHQIISNKTKLYTATIFNGNKRNIHYTSYTILKSLIQEGGIKTKMSFDQVLNSMKDLGVSYKNEGGVCTFSVPKSDPFRSDISHGCNSDILKKHQQRGFSHYLKETLKLSIVEVDIKPSITKINKIKD